MSEHKIPDICKTRGKPKLHFPILTTVMKRVVIDKSTDHAKLHYIAFLTETFTQTHTHTQKKTVKVSVKKFQFLLTQIIFFFIDVKPPRCNGLVCWTS